MTPSSASQKADAAPPLDTTHRASRWHTMPSEAAASTSDRPLASSATAERRRGRPPKRATTSAILRPTPPAVWCTEPTALLVDTSVSDALLAMTSLTMPPTITCAVVRPNRTKAHQSLLIGYLLHSARRSAAACRRARFVSAAGRAVTTCARRKCECDPSIHRPVFAERATGLAVVCSRPTHDAAWAGRARCGCSRALLRTGSFPFALRATPHPIAYRCRSVCADAHAPARPHARRCGFLRHAHAHAWPRARQRRASRPQCSRKHSRAQVWTLAASQPGVTGRPMATIATGHDRGSTAQALAAARSKAHQSVWAGSAGTSLRAADTDGLSGGSRSAFRC